MSSDLALESDALVDMLHDPVALGRILRAARKTAGMTQEQASVHLGFVRSTLVAIEQGVRRVKAAELYEMATLYQCDFTQFFTVPEVPAQPVLSARKRVLKRVFLREVDSTMHATLQTLDLPQRELERMAATLLHMLIEQEE